MKQVSDFTFVIGPPGSDDIKRQIEEWAQSSGTLANDVWGEYVHDVLGQFAHRKPDQTASNLEEVFSKILGVRVAVNAPFMSSSFQGGARCPSMMIYTEKVQSVGEQPLKVDWSDPAIRESISAVLGMVLKAKWVKTLVAYK